MDLGLAPVCTENSDSDVLVVQSPDERTRRNAAAPLDRTRYRCILVQGTMCPRFIVIQCIGAQDTAQVLLTEHHEVVNTLAADRADLPFGKAVLPWRAGCDRLVGFPSPATGA
jgi:hypothetical protein